MCASTSILPGRMSPGSASPGGAPRRKLVGYTERRPWTAAPRKNSWMGGHRGRFATIGRAATSTSRGLSGNEAHPWSDSDTGRSWASCPAGPGELPIRRGGSHSDLRPELRAGVPACGAWSAARWGCPPDRASPSGRRPEGGSWRRCAGQHAEHPL